MFLNNLNKKIVVEFGKFALVGIISTLVSYSIFLVGIKLLGIYYIFSSAIGFIFGIFISYSLNRLFTFSPSSSSLSREILTYVAVCIFSLSLSLATLYLLVELFMISPFIGNFVAIGVSTITNFSGAKLFVFRNKQSPTIN